MIVWSSILDGRYNCSVTRVEGGSSTGILMMKDGADNDKELLREEVGLSYGGAFGPDVDDVRTWQDRCAEVVDGVDV